MELKLDKEDRVPELFLYDLVNTARTPEFQAGYEEWRKQKKKAGQTAETECPA